MHYKKFFDNICWFIGFLFVFAVFDGICSNETNKEVSMIASFFLVWNLNKSEINETL